jgi:general secretion pathway protein M
MFQTPWLSRLAALLLLAAVLAAGYMWAVEPIMAAHARADLAIAETRDLQARFARLAAARSSLEAQAAAVEKTPAATAYYLAGETDALAAADLQARVTTLVESSGGALASIQTLPSQVEEGFTRIAIRLQMSSSIEALVRILHGLETGVPLLFLDNLEVQAPGAAYAGADPSFAQQPLIVSFDLYGFLPPAVAEAAP